VQKIALDSHIHIQIYLKQPIAKTEYKL